MKFEFNLKEKSATLNADVEKLVEKKLELDKDKPRPERKTRYQIKQEEQRKNKELKHKQEMQKIYVSMGALAAIIVLCLVMSLFGQ